MSKSMPPVPPDQKSPFGGGETDTVQRTSRAIGEGHVADLQRAHGVTTTPQG